MTAIADVPTIDIDLIDAQHTNPGRCEVCDRAAHIHDDGVCTRCRRAGALFATAWARDLQPFGDDVVNDVIGGDA